MKKIKLLLVLLCSEVLLVWNAYSITNETRWTPEEIRWIESILIGGDNPRPRSVTSCVDAVLDVDAGMVELNINVKLGIVTVSLTDSFGNTYYSANVDTNTTSAIQIPAPTDAGAYTIAISGSGYYGYGTFII